MQVKSSYQFKGGTAKVFADRRVVFFPVWCPMISTDVSRNELARQLRQKRSAR